jgi:hypothetical protein
VGGDVKSVRDVALADQMGSDRESLVNEAMHVFARLNGYLLPAGAAESRRDPAGPPQDGEQRAVAEQVLETAARLEREVRAHEVPPPIPSGPIEGRVRELVLVREDGTEVPVKTERFVVGRGRHCELVIDSTKVSREHAAIVKDGEGWAIEDLSSANGTWHRRARVDRRRIEDGDEYFICAERIRCVLR